MSTKAQYKSTNAVQTDTEEMAAHRANVFITGANRGLGLEMVKQMIEGSFAAKTIFASCREPDGPRAEVSLITFSVIM